MREPKLKGKSYDIPKRLLWDAWLKVKENGGAAGADRVTIEQFGEDLSRNLYRLWNRMASGSYHPGPVRAVEIPKKGKKGGIRVLGIPNVVDRVAETAATMALEPGVELIFHEDSYGYRPGRAPVDAVAVCRERCFKKDWVVDLDIRAFFDRVQHDALMARVARRVHDKRVLRLIRRYLEAGVMEGGLVHASEEGTPQGSPLSPLPSNVMLDDLDWELDRRGHNFVRYADDGRIYVRSRRAGERVMASITRYVEQRLKLRVNREKSVVDRATKRPLLGFRFAYRGEEVRVLVDPKRVKRAKDRLRQLTSRRWGVSMERRIKEINRFTVGWTAYFAFADTPSPFREARQVAQTPTAAGSMEGMDEPPPVS